jgi:hypothetical protein
MEVAIIAESQTVLAALTERNGNIGRLFQLAGHFAPQVYF